MTTYKLKIDHKKVKYDGRSFRLIIADEAVLIKQLKEKQAEILQDLCLEPVSEDTD